MNPAPAAAPSAAGANNAPAVAAPGQPPAQSNNQVGQVRRDNKGFIYTTRVEEVTLPATVVDGKGHLVTTLPQSAFVVYENDQPQQITRFAREDIPVSIGILVDNSGSMRDKRPKVAKAVLNLVQASNPQDEVFVVNFNDEAYLDQDFTSSIPLLKDALDRLDSRGGTALYDSLIAAADHLAKGGRKKKKVLLVVTDGEDDASVKSLEQAIRSVQADNGPTIYTIGILGSDGKQRSARRALEALSVQTGGVAFFPKSLDEVDEISQEVARDIRNQYSITYKPSNPQANGGYRRIKVIARAPGYKNLQVRTRSGYFPDQERTSASSTSPSQSQ